MGQKTLLQRAGLILILFILAASVSYSGAANWGIDQFNKLTSFEIGHLEYPIVLGLDLQGGSHLEYVADLSEIPYEERSSAMEGVRDVIERRVNQLGVSEPLVQTIRAGDQWRLTVELAGIRDINEAIRMIGETPILEFRTENTELNRPLTDEETAQLEEKNNEQWEKAKAALDRVNTGESIETLSAELSDDPVIASQSGDLGFVLDQLDYQKLTEVFRDQEPGYFHNEIIDDGQNYYIAELIEKKTAGEEAKASHILVQWNESQQTMSTSTKEEARATIDDIRSQVTSENFDEMARQYSEEPGAENTAGDLGYFEQGVMVPPFEEAVWGMGVGDISDVVETQFGFHIIKKTDQRERMDVHVRAIVFKKAVASDIIPSDPYIRTELTGKQLDRAVLDFDPQTGIPIVVLEFDKEGTDLFAQLTEENVGKPIAIYLDGQPISIPTVQQKITGGQAVISGSFTIDEAKLLAQRLQAGALPVSIHLIAQQSVGPTLGAESVDRSLKAGLVGFLLVILFMILYYRLPGLVSVFSLAFYAAILFALFKLVPVTLSLSGIAGFILSLGMAVDANVLIFERLKEEMRTDKPLYANIDEAFRRAWMSIRDGNATTLIVCLVLYTFTSSLVKGFALTLGLGIIVSMFTAIIITKTIMRLLATTPLKKISWLFLGSGK